MMIQWHINSPGFYAKAAIIYVRYELGLLFICAMIFIDQVYTMPDNNHAFFYVTYSKWHISLSKGIGNEQEMKERRKHHAEHTLHCSVFIVYCGSSEANDKTKNKTQRIRS